MKFQIQSRHPDYRQLAVQELLTTDNKFVALSEKIGQLSWILDVLERISRKLKKAVYNLFGILSNNDVASELLGSENGLSVGEHNTIETYELSR